MQKKIKRELSLLYETLRDLLLIVAIALLIGGTILINSIMLNDNYDLVNQIVRLNNYKYYPSTVAVMKALEQMPSEHLQQIIDNKYELIVDNELLREQYDIHENTIPLSYENIGGLTVFETKTVYIRSNITSCGYAALHEMGHILDYCNNRVSSDKEFIECYNKEKNTIREYAKQSSLEYFADLYALEIHPMRLFTYTTDDFRESINYMKSQEWW